MNNYSLIIFDWAGVFCTPGEPLAHRAFYTQTGFDTEKIGDLTKSIQTKYYEGKISTEEFWDGLISTVGLTGVTPQELESAYLNSYAIRPEMLELVSKLKNKYKTVLLSNMTKVMMDHIVDKFKLNNYFDQMFFSNEVGVSKPDRKIYDLVLQELKEGVQNTIFIDDSEKNVAAAESLGIKGLVYTSTPKLIEDLLKIGISISK